MRKACRLLCTSPGAAGGGLQLEYFSPPPLSSGQALVQVLAAPIHPADLNALEGTYGVRRTPPFVPGNEGVGRVIQVAEDVSLGLVGKKVLLPYGCGSWTSHLVWDADALLCVPEEIPLPLAAQAQVNPLTALCLLELASHTAKELGTNGEVVLAQNAANSAVGLSVIQLAPRFGMRTLNIVRSPQAAKVAAQHGAQLILVDPHDTLTSSEIQAAAQNPLPVGLNAVGGSSATTLAGALAEGGTLITYGAMSRKAMKIPASFLIFRDIRLQGFWLQRWFRRTSRQILQEKIDLLLQEMVQLHFTLPAGPCFSLEQFADALAAATTGHRQGKVFFLPSDSVGKSSPR